MAKTHGLFVCCPFSGHLKFIILGVNSQTADSLSGQFNRGKGKLNSIKDV